PPFFCLRIRLPPLPPLFPYTTLFRSGSSAVTNTSPLVTTGAVISRPSRAFTHIVLPDSGATAYTKHFCGVVDILKGHAVRKSALDRKSTRLNSSHVEISYAVFCLKKK